MELFGIGSYSAITVICYLMGAGIKLSPLGDRYIPLLCGTVGAALGIAAHYFMAGFPAGDLLTAAAMGAVSGLAATGLDQSVKQLRNQP